MRTSMLRRAAAAAVLLALAGGTAHAKGKTFALIMYNQQVSFFTDIAKGAQKAADEVGDKLQVFDANNSASAQDNAFETYIQQKVDGIIISAVDPDGIGSAIRAADKAGIPVASVDSVLPPGPQKIEITVDNEAAGKLIGDFYVDYVKKTLGGKATLGVVAALNSNLQLARQKGFKSVTGAAPGITEVGVVDGRNIQDQALAAGENLLTGNPTLDTVYATGEPALIGAIAAAASQGRDKVKIFGWDLSAQAIAAIDAGQVVGVVQQAPDQEGYQAVKALDVLTGGGKAAGKVSIPITIVTKDNVDPYRAAYK